MKKICLSLLLVIIILFSGCTANHTDKFQPGTQNPANTTSSVSIPSVPDGESASAGHVDKDNDGICDKCKKPVVLYYDFYALNDLHGKFCDSSAQPGVNEMTAYFENARKENERVIVLSSGDMWQGSSESNLTKGKLVTEWMNETGTVSMTMGNHEFDWGEEGIKENIALADFPFLAINIYDKATGRRVDYLDSSIMVDIDGMQIGIIGAIGDCYSSISGDKTENIYFKTGKDLTELVKAESKHLKDMGADYIVYSIHDGYGKSMDRTVTISGQKIASYYDTSLSDGYVDLVFEGHTHQSYVFTDDHGVYHLQGGGDNRGLSHVRVGLNFANGNSFVKKAEFVPSDEYAKAEASKKTDELLEKYSADIAPAYRVVGQNDTRRNGNELRRKVADLYYEAGLEKWGGQYPIVLGGGYISIRSPKVLGEGEVRYADLYMLFPFDNRLVLCSVRGADLKSNFFDTRNNNYFISYGDYGESVRNNINPNATYYIVTDAYSSSYVPNHLTPVEYYQDNIFARDLLSEFIGKGGYAKTNAETTPDGGYALTSIADILKIGNALAVGEETSGLYFVRGRIESISNDRYGNMTICDESGNKIYVFGVNSKDGKTRYDRMEDKPRVGDTVILKASVMKYSNKGSDSVVELFHARLQKTER